MIFHGWGQCFLFLLVQCIDTVSCVTGRALGSLKTCARNKSWKRAEGGQLTHIQWKMATEVGLVVMVVVMVGGLFYKVALLMATLRSRCGHYIFVLFLSSFFLVFCHLGSIAQLCQAVSSQLRHVSTIRKNLVKQQYLLHMSS